MWALALFLLTTNFSPQSDHDTIALYTATDPNLHINLKASGLNLNLNAINEKVGSAKVRYQNGKGYAAFDRDTQSLQIKLKMDKPFVVMPKSLKQQAPWVDLAIPLNSELAFRCDARNIGIADLNFGGLHLESFVFEARSGEVILDFPTENKTMVRKKAIVSVSAGSLTVKNLGHLRAPLLKINGGIGELDLHWGEALFLDTELRLDHDMGQLTLTLPKGLHVQVRGTNRDMAPFGFIRSPKGWVVSEYVQSSKQLTIRLLGPLGDFQLLWE
jgi:hypothetical protein